MSNKRIIFPNQEGGVSIKIPSPEWLSQPGNTMEKLAATLPAGTPFQIVDVADIPTDRTFRNAWTFEE
jgi:hypothetical protein